MFAYLNVQEVVLPYDIIAIESNAFFRSSITSIIFPETIKLLQKYGEIDSNLTLKEVYNKYFHGVYTFKAYDI